jgi:hypothetical protein
MMRLVVQRARPYQAVLCIPGQLPTPTPTYFACDDVQAARRAIADWAGLDGIEIADIRRAAKGEAIA